MQPSLHHQAARLQHTWSNAVCGVQGTRLPLCQRHVDVCPTQYTLNYSRHSFTQRLPPVSLAGPKLRLGKPAGAAVAATAVAAAALPGQLDGSSLQQASSATTQAEAAAQQQSFEVLEWPAVCRQVACFCGTSMAAELLLAGQLPIGCSLHESEMLLQQTQGALDAQLEVTGVFDLRPALEAAAAGGILNARQLEGVASSMESAFELRAIACAAATTPDQTNSMQTNSEQQQKKQQKKLKQQESLEQQQQQWQQYQYPCLAQLASGIQERELTTLRAVRSCISDGGVLSEASPELTAVREARQSNREAARTLATQIARELHAQGAAEGRDPMLLRGRYCVAVKRSRRSAVSKGSVKLGESGTGATLYLEPAEVLELNNREAQLADEENQAELIVLQALSQFLAERGPAIEGMLQAVTSLDIVAARAKHARWCSAVRPVFVDSSRSSRSGGSNGSNGSHVSSSSRKPEGPGSSPLHLPGARHPLLLQPSLPPLPRPPSADDASFGTDFIPPPLFAFATAGSSSSSDSDSDEGQGSGDGVQSRPGQGLTRTAKPLDLRVPGTARVVAITGPNTGGKTVTLKTAGLLALMAKAGMFLTCHQHADADAAATTDISSTTSSSSSSSSSGSRDAGSSSSSSSLQPPYLLWFDKVLADIGDSQSLEQNLSTFSGHIARLKLMLAAAGPLSLVLLDEVGSGTDPQEGSALARAVLDVLAGQARLTLATSHHAELKTAADEDGRYFNVSLEFNTRTLQPTYRLMWGSAGSSNALDIAQALGFDPKVLSEARILARAELGRQEEQRGRMEQVAASVEGQLAAARASLASQTAEREMMEQQAEVLQVNYRKMIKLRQDMRTREKLVEQEAAEMVLTVQQAAVKFRQAKGQLEDVQAAVGKYAQKISSPVAGGSGSGVGIKPGDSVVVPSLGVANPFVAKVAKVSGDTVYLDSMSMTNPLLQKRKNAALLRFRMDQVVPAEQLQAPEAIGWEGLKGVSAQQAAAEQQMLDDVNNL